MSELLRRTIPDVPVLDWPVALFLGGVHLGALAALLPGTFSWGAVGVAVLLHWLTACLGITLGYHRLITHRSFKAPKLIEYLTLFCGTLACQSPIEWVGKHRMHHQHTDTIEDPHNIGRGFWWAHVGWILHRLPCDRLIPQYTKDINRDPVYRFLDRTMVGWQVVLAVLLYLLGGWPFVVWGIFVRLAVVYQCTWLVNSGTHLWGSRPHASGDRSANNWWIALLTYGEGWHNNHHTFPSSARQGLRWWQIDVTWWVICGLRAVGLASRVKTVPAAA